MSYSEFAFTTCHGEKSKQALFFIYMIVRRLVCRIVAALERRVRVASFDILWLEKIKRFIVHVDTEALNPRAVCKSFFIP